MDKEKRTPYSFLCFSSIRILMIFSIMFFLLLFVALAQPTEPKKDEKKTETPLPGLIVDKGTAGTITKTDQNTVNLNGVSSACMGSLCAFGMTATATKTEAGISFPRVDSATFLAGNDPSKPVLMTQATQVSGTTIGDTTTLSFGTATIDWDAAMKNAPIDFKGMKDSIIITANTNDGNGKITLTPQRMDIDAKGAISYRPVEGVTPITINPSGPVSVGTNPGGNYVIASGTATLPGGQITDARFCEGTPQACQIEFAKLGLTIDAVIMKDGKMVYIAYAKKASHKFPGRNTQNAQNTQSNQQSATTSAQSITSQSSFFNTLALSENISQLIIEFGDDRMLSDVQAELSDIEGMASDSEGSEAFIRSASSADFSTASGTVSIVSGQDMQFSNGLLFVGKAQSVTKNGAIIVNAQTLILGDKRFYVGKADLISLGCTKIGGISNMFFEVTGDRMRIWPRDSTRLSIQDCLSNAVFFESRGGNLTLMRTKPLTYHMSNGLMIVASANYSERIDTNNSAIVEFDDRFGIACVTMEPEGTYWYNDRNIKKDFAINIPKKSGTFKLCFRRGIDQVFVSYQGMVNFLQNYVLLTKPASYLKYPFKLKQVASLLMVPLQQNLDILNATIQLDGDLVGIESIEIKSGSTAREQSLTTANNYYSIHEKMVNEELHSLVFLDLRIQPKYFNDVLFGKYESSSLETPLFRDEKALVLRKGFNSVRFLPPAHADITRLVNG